MICGAISSTAIPALQMSDQVGWARQTMNDFSIEYLPVIEEQLFKGIIHLDDLDEANDEQHVADLASHFFIHVVQEEDFFLTALKLMHEHNIYLLPVLNPSGEYTGSITRQVIIETVSTYLSAGEPGGVIILQMPPHQFSISELGRIIESNNAKILHLTTWTDRATGELMVSMKLNKFDIHDILASFERHQFTVSRYFGENLSEETLKNNFDHLMNYLKL